MTLYSAGSFAQPIRRVFGTVVFRARESVQMPLPGNVVWRISASICAITCGRCSMRRSRAAFPIPPRSSTIWKFLTIRQFLSLVFSALVILLLVLAIWL